MPALKFTDAAGWLAGAWRDGLRPDPDLPIAAWADKNHRLTPQGAAEPGPYRANRTPYVQELYRVLGGDHPAQRVVVMKGSQLGFTEAGNAWIGYLIDNAPGPILAVQPTVQLGKRFSQQRLAPMIEASPALSRKMAPPRARDSGNTMLTKQFPGGILVITGANSAVGLRSMPVRYLFLDEIDAYPADADEEGDPVRLAEARTRTFSWRRKVLLISTPTIAGISRIEREYQLSDQRRYFVPCPHCGLKQVLVFAQLRWDRGKPHTAAYVCEGCGAAIDERHKTAMLEAGEWRATASAIDPLTVGFHVSGLYSPTGWLSWAEIAADWETAQDAGDEAIRAVVNGYLGETWTETGEAPDWQRLYERREDYLLGTVPLGGLLLTGGADVQRDRIEVSIWAWGRGLESWLVDHIVIAGGPNDPAAWEAMNRLLATTWPHECGTDLGLTRLAIDTGYQAPEVYGWARRAGAQVVAIKGVEGFNKAAPVSGPTHVDATERGRKIRRGAKLWTVAVATFKSETYRFLRQPAAIDGEPYPFGYVHLPRGVHVEWLKQLTAERLVTVQTRRGFSRLEWQLMRERNEALDNRVYARAAAWIVGLDHWHDRRWRELEEHLGTVAPAPPPEPAAIPPPGALMRRAGWINPRRSGWLGR